MNKEWIEVTIVTTSEAVEAVSGIFYNVDVKGISILDSEDVEFKKKNESDWDYFDESLLNIKSGAVVKAYFKQDETFNEKLEYIKKKIDDLDKVGLDKGEGFITVAKVNEEDWENNWKKYYKSTKIGENIVVKPIWEEYNKKDDEIVLELDPGMAFGTGTHETTRMCIKALEKYVDNDAIVFDIGTGSGILSIAAAKLGAKNVVGVDLDPVAVASAKKNVDFNKIDNIEILHGNLMEVVKGKADIVVANIIADIILLLSKDVEKFIVPGGKFISSGIILDRKDEIINKLEDCGFRIDEVNIEGEWTCIVASLL